MIGGQHRDITGDDADLEALHRLKTGALFEASVGLGLRLVKAPEGEVAAWRVFGSELGLLFQAVDDILDGDGYVARVGMSETRELADRAAARARGALDEVSGDTSVLRQLVDELAFRTG
jgi:geranylgeranyl diphosphate synthase type II